MIILKLMNTKLVMGKQSLQLTHELMVGPLELLQIKEMWLKLKKVRCKLVVLFILILLIKQHVLL